MGGCEIMKCTLTTQEKLKDLREARNLKLQEVAKATGIGKSTIANYENDEYKEMQLYVLQQLAIFYEVPLVYLIGLTDNLTESSSSIDDLHLDDDTVKILKEKRINNRLLCEMIKHPSFVNFMSDLQIYVDNIAGSYINNLNLYITEMRDTIKNISDIPDDDFYMKTIEKSYIDEDDYFGDLLESDLKRIAKDIRTAHKKDWDTADETPIVKEVIDSIKRLIHTHVSEELPSVEHALPVVVKPSGGLASVDKAQIVKWSNICGINLTVYTDEEFELLAYLIKKGCKHPLFKNPPKGRGKHR